MTQVDVDYSVLEFYRQVTMMDVDWAVLGSSVLDASALIFWSACELRL